MNSRLSPVADTDGQVQRAPAGGTAMRRVLFVTYEFPPSLEMGAQTCAQLTRHLPLHGWEPTVLTVRERYHPSVDHSSPGTEAGPVIRTRVMPHPLAVYRRLKTALVAAGPVRPSPGALRRGVISLLDIPDRYTGWILPAVVAGLREIRRRPVEHLCSSAPYWSNHVVGLLLSRLTGLPWTAHFRDPWTFPGSAQAREVATPWTKRIDALLERAVVRRARSVVTVTDPHTRFLRQQYPDAPGDRFVTIPNGFDGTEWERAEREDDGPEATRGHRFVITYAGTLYSGRTPRPLFRALQALVDGRRVDPARITVDLVGECDIAEGRPVSDLAAECGVGRLVTITGPVSRAEALRRFARSSLLLLLAEDQPLQVPGKTYEYLRSGKPILALTRPGAVADLLGTTGGAWIVDPSREAEIASAVLASYEAWTHGRTYPTADPGVVARFDRQGLAGRLAEVFDGASQPPAAGQS